jgi:hypothetical protein
LGNVRNVVQQTQNRALAGVIRADQRVQRRQLQRAAFDTAEVLNLEAS